MDKPTGEMQSSDITSSRKAAEGIGLTDEQNAWLQRKKLAQSTIVLPKGACHTVYYITKDGRRAHFTPGLPPKKKVLDGPKWGPEKHETEESDEEIEIPAPLE